MNAERLINRWIVAIGLGIAGLTLCAEMETLSTMQFVTAKIMAALFGWAVIIRARQLDEEGKL